MSAFDDDFPWDELDLPYGINEILPANEKVLKQLRGSLRNLGASSARTMVAARLHNDVRAARRGSTQCQGAAVASTRTITAKSDVDLLAELRASRLGTQHANEAQKTINAWTKRARSSAVDKPAAEHGLEMLFEAAGAKLRGVWWCPSPLVALAHASTSGECVNQNIIYNSLTTAMGALIGQLSRETHDELVQVFSDNIPARNDAAIAGVTNAIKAELIERARVIKNETLEHLINKAQVFSLDAAHIAVYDFAANVLRVKGCERVRGVSQVLAAGVDWCWVFGDTAVVAPRPDVIALEGGVPHKSGGPAIEYSGDKEFSVCCWRGKWIPHSAAKVEWGKVETLNKASADLQAALVEVKAKEWSEKKPKHKQKAPTVPAAAEPITSKAAAPEDTESEDERFEAAMAIKRLGGVSAVKDLTESDDADVDEEPSKSK